MGVAEVAELTTSVECLLAVDAGALGDAELSTAVIELVQLTSRFTAAVTAFVDEWDARRLWSSDGSKAAGARLARDARCAPEAGKALVGRARKLRTMPLTVEGFRAGSLSTDHVDVLCRANRAKLTALFQRDEHQLLDSVPKLDFDNWRKTVAHWRNIADDDIAEDDAEHQHGSRYLRGARTMNGVVDIQARLAAVDGGIVLDELDRIEQELFHADWAAARAEFGDLATERDLARTTAQRKADALVEMARRSAAMPADARQARPLVTILCGYETFAGRVCELADGTVLTPGQVAATLNDADIERVVFDSPSRVIDVGTRTRFFTGALRRAIEVRDRHCTHPGCMVPAIRCQVDHIIEHCDGGETTQANGRLLCPHHNRRRPGRTTQPAEGP